MIIRFLISLILFSVLPVSAEMFTDEFVDATLDKSLLRPEPVVLLMKDSPLRAGNYSIPQVRDLPPRDRLVEITLAGKVFEKPWANLDYDYSDNNYAVIQLRPLERISTNGNLKNGDMVKFAVVQDVYFDEKLVLKKNSVMNAVVENISPNDRYGVPAHLVVSRFSVAGIDPRMLDGTFSKQGRNHSLWVYPLSYFTMPFFCAGIGFTFIRGVNVKLNQSDIIEIYYRPTRFKKAF